MRDPLPAGYYYLFWLVEPALTLAGAGYAIFLPERYAADLLPAHYERVTKIMGNTVRGQMVVGGLGSCFLLVAMISLSLFPIIKHTLRGHAAAQEKLVKGLLVPLAIADLTHIFFTLLPLPMSLLETPARWTTLINGNVWITTGLFLARVAYLLGIGRTASPPPAQTLAALDTKPKDAPAPAKDAPSALAKKAPALAKDAPPALAPPATESRQKAAPPPAVSTPTTPSKTPRRRTRAKELAPVGDS